MIEEWRSIEGYEGLYEVSNTGRVRSVDRYVKVGYGGYRLHKGKILKLELCNCGYYSVEITYKYKRNHFYVHRLVAEAFIPNPDNLAQVNHKDEDKTNNNVENLEWCNRKYNMNYGTRAERRKKTNIQKGLWTGLSQKEYRKQYVENNRDKIREINRRAYLKRKMIQNNVKSLNDQI